MTDAQFARRYEQLRARLERHSRTLAGGIADRTLLDGSRYVLGSGGKRIRSMLVVLACEAVGGNAATALDAGTALETLHNFTLVHDDILDNAATRRGRPTVHVKWDLPTALLVGDVLVGLAYRRLLATRRGDPVRLAHLLTDGLVTVCDGQSLDMAFEHRTDVTVREYFRMIERKTGRLFSLAAEMGGVIGDGSPRQIRALRAYGHHLGRAFQLQDDLLDVTAAAEKLGKPIGGDILEGKKTFLLLTAWERARGKDRRLLQQVFRRTGARPSWVRDVTDMYRRLGVLTDAERLIRRETRQAVRALATLPGSTATDMLRRLAEALSVRAS